ncbi:TIGR02117 family protein [Mucilaginibacter psychrotolerans]|uniref:TIGR02117 family protein n=1 Tax=Mucilaginibacter psychrotolerans TaxID=1524096 RepID=A0A4Y8SLK3_9SPHI|nr:TIGR02117 family protein [Mucilaginibacter psychrotolerans]TFF39256.1 TIGR02117 family protein [Mucilaginibacter psychrotolerans]
MRKFIKISLRVVLGFVAFVALYLFAAWSLSKIAISAEPVTTQDVTIYILTNGVHTDIVVPVKNEQVDWSKELKFENTVGKDTVASYVGMGWGDKGFYLNTPTWADLKFSTAFKAAFALSTSAMHVTYHKELIESATCKKIIISKAQYARLITYVTESFKTDSAGHFINIKTNANYGKDDAFYEAHRKYNLFFTCNTWANNTLKSCGQKACLWTPADTPIFDKYR